MKSNEDSLWSCFRYTCTPACGLRGATISTLQRPGEDRFVMELSVDFGIEDFGAASKLVHKRLGKPKKALPYYAVWKHTEERDQRTAPELAKVTLAGEAVRTMNQNR